MKKIPKFSIVIPIYNVEDYLSQCLDSVISQTIRDIEIICINDGTKDRSRMILEEYQKLDSRILIVDKKNGGLSSARNKGIEYASGEYILFLDSDDYLECHTCERIFYEVLEHHPDIIVFGTHIFPYYPWPDRWLIDNLSPRSIVYDNNSIAALTKEKGATPFVWRDCFKRDFLLQNQLIFDESVRFAEDLIFQFESFPLAKKIIFISDKLYHYRWVRPGSLMAYAQKNVYKKYMQHIDAMEIIAGFWKKHGLLTAYAKEFFAWSVDFIGWDLYNYEGPNKKNLILRTRQFWKEYGLNKNLKSLSKKAKAYYLYICKEAL